LLLTAVVVATQSGRVRLFLESHEEIRASLSGMFSSAWVWGCGAAAVAAAVVLLRRGAFSGRARAFLSGIKEGLLAVRSVPRVGWFIFHTLFIWLMYFLMLYACFFSFAFTSDLGPMTGLTVFVISSYGMVAPVQGGVGAWHFMVIAALALYLPATGEMESLSKAFALLTHGTMTVVYILLGVACLLYLPIYNRRK
ncbi:MAG: lysylphosphatidylglycerol synthase domain-containing protein, partial [Odoribacteraceae bacterium]|nr:lysylphosphatidylglycerol synthase domain-containing protein [Odoribacteraceae bacterium]